MAVGLIGRKLGMMRLYDPTGRVHGVTVLEIEPNRVTHLRTQERDGYEAVQVGAHGNRKRLTRPQRGHLRNAGLDGQVLDVLQEFRVDSAAEFELGQALTVERFEPGQYVNVSATSKGRGFAGGVRRWHFRGGPKTHGQSDRHRAPGSIGAGTTPGKVFKGLKMAGHMGAQKSTITNLLVVLTDPARNLIFVEGSVPGPRGALVTVTPGRRAPLAGFEPPVIPSAEEAVPEPAPVPAAEAPAEAGAEPAAEPVAEAGAETEQAQSEPEAATEPAAEPAAEEPAAETEADDEEKSEA